MCMTAIVFSVISTGFQAFAAMKQAKSQKAALDYKAAIARNNVITANRNAAAIGVRAERAETDHRRRISAAKSTWRADVAKRGVLVDDTPDTTVNEELGNIAQFGEYDIALMYDDAELRMRQARIEGTNFQATADLADFESSTINPMGMMAGTLLGGSGDIYGTYRKGGYSGITGGPNPLFGVG